MKSRLVIPPKSLKGKVALVTGAGSGIGAATAELLAVAGAKVALVGRSMPGLKRVAKRISDGNGRSMIVQCDVSDAGAVEQAVAAVAAKWKRLDIVVANAGINGVWAPLEEISTAEWDRTMAVNLRGGFLTLRHTVPHLRVRGGSVVLIASINGSRVFSNSGATAYSCSKAGLVALTKMAALELAPDRIRVNVVCPGSITTSIEDSTRARKLESIRPDVSFPNGEVPLTGGKPGSAEDVARLVWFLASNLSNHITGTEVFIDGAQSILRG